MAFSFVPQLIIIFSIGVIVVILGKNISKARSLSDDEYIVIEKKAVRKEKEKFIYLYRRLKKRITKEEYNNKIDLLWVWLEKKLRKIRINFLKIDNKIVSILDKVREKNTEIEVDKPKQIDNIREYENTYKEEIKDVNEHKDKDPFLITKIQEKKEEEFIPVSQEKRDRYEADKKEVFSNENIEEIEIGGQKSEGDKIERINIEKELIISETVEESETIEKKDKREKNVGKEEKEKKYIEMILKNPIDIKAYWNLGIIYSRKKNYKDAISCFKQITKIDPTYTKAKTKISDLMKKMKEKKEAKDEKKEEKKRIKKEEKEKNVAEQKEIKENNNKK